MTNAETNMSDELSELPSEGDELRVGYDSTYGNARQTFAATVSAVARDVAPRNSDVAIYAVTLSPKENITDRSECYDDEQETRKLHLVTTDGGETWSADTVEARNGARWNRISGFTGTTVKVVDKESDETAGDPEVMTDGGTEVDPAAVTDHFDQIRLDTGFRHLRVFRDWMKLSVAAFERDSSAPVVVRGTDIDADCARMCVVNLVIAGVPGVVQHGDSIKQEIRHQWRVVPDGSGPVVREPSPEDSEEVLEA